MPRRRRELDPNTTLTKRQMDNSRAAISTTKIIQRLQQNFNGELDEPLTPSQLKSAELLIARTLPVLQSTEVTQDVPNMGDPLEAEQQFNAYMKEYIERMPTEKKLELLTDGNTLIGEPGETTGKHDTATGTPAPN